MPDPTTARRDAMLAEIEASYESLCGYLDGLDETALTGPTDAAGWTATDHVFHLAVWTGSMLAVIEGRPRWEAMGVSEETWSTIADGYDEINADIQRRHRDGSPPEARRALEAAHRALLDHVATMTEAELSLPYSHFQPWATGQDDPMYAYVRGNTAEHYDEHREYIEVLVGSL